MPFRKLFHLVLLSTFSVGAFAASPQITIEDEFQSARTTSSQIERDFGDIPESDVKLEPTIWSFESGESLTSVLSRWCGLSGCNLVKKTNLDMDMMGTFKFKGDALSAFKALFEALDNNGSNFRARLYTNNVLVLDHVLKNESVVVER